MKRTCAIQSGLPFTLFACINTTFSGINHSFYCNYQTENVGTRLMVKNECTFKNKQKIGIEDVQQLILAMIQDPNKDRWYIYFYFIILLIDHFLNVIDILSTRLERVVNLNWNMWLFRIGAEKVLMKSWNV